VFSVIIVEKHNVKAYQSEDEKSLQFVV